MDDVGNPPSAADGVETFDPVSNSWSAAADLPVPVAGAFAIRLADGNVLLAGGSVREPELTDADAGTYVSGLTADAELFDADAGTWTATTPSGPEADPQVVRYVPGS